MKGFQLGGTHLNKPGRKGLAESKALFCGGKQMIINSDLSDIQLLDFIYKAACEYSNLVGNQYLIVGKNKNSNYFWFQCHFEKKHFMHLLGIHSNTLSAIDFFELSLNRKLTISDCSPSRNHNRRTVNEKCSCCADMLRIQDAKYMKVGFKDKISKFVDFTYAYGSLATLGFSLKDKNLRNSAFPITLIPRNIDEFSSFKYKIIFVFRKNLTTALYREPFAEIKRGLFVELYSNFPPELKNLILPEIRELSSLGNISTKTLRDMDAAIANFKCSNVSKGIDLSDF